MVFPVGSEEVDPTAETMKSKNISGKNIRNLDTTGQSYRVILA